VIDPMIVIPERRHRLLDVATLRLAAPVASASGPGRVCLRAGWCVIVERARRMQRACAQTLFRDQHTGTGKQSHLEQVAPFKSGSNQLATIVAAICFSFSFLRFRLEMYAIGKLLLLRSWV